MEFGDAIDPALNEAVGALDFAVARARLPGIIETIPTYRSLLIEFEPQEVSFTSLTAQVRELLRSSRTLLPRSATRRLIVPIAYGAEFGDDLDNVAQALGVEPDAVANLHLAAEYRVYMIGFMPGFAYLGGVPAELFLPRRRAPRACAPAGSVMIGGRQGAIAALPLPTGWYVIGRTPARGFDPTRTEPFLFRAGDSVRFRRIDAYEFSFLADIAAHGGPVIEAIS